jgi:hypothetical protein
MPTPQAPARTPLPHDGWTHRRFFEILAELSPLRVISISGPSVFEAICGVGPFGIADGHLNAITDAYHWHVDLADFTRVRSRDQTHARSGRRVLFFELLARGDDARPFLSIYLHRGKGEEFAPEREARFLAAHRDLAVGVELRSEVSR